MEIGASLKHIELPNIKHLAQICIEWSPKSLSGAFSFNAVLKTSPQDSSSTQSDTAQGQSANCQVKTMTDFVEKVQKPRILFALLESSYTFSIPVEQVNHRIHSNHCVLMCIDCFDGRSWKLIRA